MFYLSGSFFDFMLFFVFLSCILIMVTAVKVKGLMDDARLFNL